MNSRRALIGLGSGITTLLVVGALVIEALAPRGDVGPGIVGVIAGFVAGVLAAVLVASQFHRLPVAGRWVLVAIAAFGYAFLGVWALQYVNVAGLRQTIDMPMHLALSVVVAAAVGLVGWARDRPSGSR